MERPPPPSPPFPFPNNNSSFSQAWDYSSLFEEAANSSLIHFQSNSASYNNNNLSSTPPPQQMMEAPNYDSAAAYQHQSFVPQPYLPTSWIINDPSGVALPFHDQPPTYNYHQSSYDYLSQQQINNALATKAARDNRKMVRKKTINSTRTPSSSLQVPPTTLSLTPPPHNHPTIPVVADHHHPPQPITSSNNKKLKLVFKKELKNSDVSPLGRIVIPKKDAEENLPPLTSREGIKLVVKDLYSDRQWSLKYKFWCNNKSRMYVLENAGDFMKKNGLKMGDLIILYLDEEYRNYFFSIKRAEEIRWEKHLAAEEDAALALMIENLRHGDEQEEEANNLLTMDMQGGAGGLNTHMASSSSSQGINFGEEFGSVNHNILPSFDDICWMGNHYNYDGSQ